ncbi:conjugative transposon protein TraM, partial [Bacteroides uniformis]|uniref:conjugative transposon protein TraM n=1 Tax=Bacteroides uniformis TaxID=820 RepID=UPI001C039312
FCLLCMGFLLLVFSPSEKEKAEMEKGKGFNVEMPSPEDSEMEGNKVSAYEQEALVKKEKWRRGTFQEMSELLNKDGQDTAGLTAGKANMELPPEPEKGKAPGSIRSSAEAYRNMNRSLGTVYTRNENQPNADLLRRIEDLEKERKPAEEQAEGQTLEEKMALLEKSYELAARYNGKEPDASSTTNAPNSRNHTPVGKMPSSGRNTIAACVHGTQTVSDGQALRIRLLEPMAVDDLLIPKGTVLVGGTRVEGERMGILIETVEYRGTLFPVELEVYDADGQQGILVPNSME